VKKNSAGEFSFMRFLCKKLVMELVVLANDDLKEELSGGGINHEMEIIWAKTIDDFRQQPNADGFIDLLFDNSQKRIELLKELPGKPVIINSVVHTLEKMQAPFIRINAWPGFLKRSLIEASLTGDNNKQQAEKIFSLLHKKIEWLPDQPGFITARVIAMIINESYFALEEEVSTKEEIDIAMKLGTNYPYGPFEWCDKIGIKNIFWLLNELSKTNPRYTPAGLLEKEALA
jgi:3-hydroxybutyryl-CoA dehydrogenase